MTDSNGDPVFYRITNREVFERLGTVEAKLDRALSHIDTLDGHISDLSKRTRALELRFYGVLAGLIGAIALLVRFGVGG